MGPVFDHSQLRRFLADPSSWRVLVVGAGKSGRAVLCLLHKLGARVRLTDLAPASEMDKPFAGWIKENGIAWEHGGHKLETFLQAHLIVVSPGVSLEISCLKKAGEKGIPIIGELGFAYLFLDGLPVIGVTGTNGKTTVTNMLAALFKEAGRKVFVGGNIGRPLSEYLLEVTDNIRSALRAELAVLEISSYQLETAGSFRPDLGILLNISPDHLDRYDSYNDYAETKFSLFANQHVGDRALLNLDDPEIRKRMSGFPGQGEKFYWGNRLQGRQGACLYDEEVVLTFADRSEEYRLPESLQSSPCRENTMAAVLAARLAGCPPEAITKGLASFKPSAHRITRVAEIDGVVFYDDSKATNIGAVQSALAGMDRPVILIAGGRDKGGDYRLLAPLIQEKVKFLFLIGEAREKMARALDQVVSIQMAGDLQEGVYRAVEAAVPGDAVLLSPACASFDMYRDYIERGLHFQEIINSIESQAGKPKAPERLTN
ncbi:MAG: UDP-N-acetylmuramoyl-L-alanine--D-glutamate ligase [Thermodesulfobacteriota bacterium]